MMKLVGKIAMIIWGIVMTVPVFLMMGAAEGTMAVCEAWEEWLD